mgnify:CR=1 FL=1
MPGAHILAIVDLGADKDKGTDNNKDANVFDFMINY